MFTQWRLLNEKLERAEVVVTRGLEGTYLEIVTW